MDRREGEARAGGPARRLSGGGPLRARAGIRTAWRAGLVLALGTAGLAHAQTRPQFRDAVGRLDAALRVSPVSSAPGTRPGHEILRIELHPPPAGWTWDASSVRVTITRASTGAVLDSGPATPEPRRTYSYLYDWARSDPGKGPDPANPKDYKVSASATVAAATAPSDSGAAPSFTYSDSCGACCTLADNFGSGMPMSFVGPVLPPAAPGLPDTHNILPGIVTLVLQLKGAPDGWHWNTASIQITVNSEQSQAQLFTGMPTPCGSGPGGDLYCLDWSSLDPSPGAYPRGHVNGNPQNGLYCYVVSATATVVENVPMGAQCPQHTSGPNNDLLRFCLMDGRWTRYAPYYKLQTPCDPCSDVPTRSETDPNTGDQTWNVPISSWDDHGATHAFGLTYNSVSLHDPTSLPTPDFAGMADRNDKWSHTYAQWVDLYRDEQDTAGAGPGNLYSVWHRGGTYQSFEQTYNPAGPITLFGSPDSYHSITYTTIRDSNGVPQPYTHSITCGNNASTVTGVVAVPFAGFTVTDGDDTSYSFGGSDASVFWQPDPPGAMDPATHCADYPHFLLTAVTDRWGRSVTVHWDTTGSAPHVTSVRDSNNAGVLLTYSGALLSQIQKVNGFGVPIAAPATLAYTAYNDEEMPAVAHSKLTGATVYGAGDTQVRYDWQFGYSDTYPDNPDSGTSLYSGTYTGDLVTRKMEPDGSTTYYRHEQVVLGNRPTNFDAWDGRVTRIFWIASSEVVGFERQIDRGLTIDSHGQPRLTMTYPGNPGAVYPHVAEVRPAYYMDYGGGRDLELLQDVLNPTRVWGATYDDFHNVASQYTPRESSSSPLIRTAYVFSFAENVSISQAVTTDVLGHQTTVQFNAFHLPTQIVSTSSDQSHDQHVDYQYDFGGALTHGNLTRVARWGGTPAAGTFQQLVSYLTYSSPDAPDAPSEVVNPVGGASLFGYEPATGRSTSETSPANTALLSTCATLDFLPSTSSTTYFSGGGTRNASGGNDGLPMAGVDPLGHNVTFDYTADGSGAGNLRVTTTWGDDKTRVHVLDPAGRILSATDENGVKTLWTYNPQGQVKTVVEAAGLPQARTTAYSYDFRGDLQTLTLPGGGQYQFEYFRYSLNDPTHPIPVANPSIYEGRPTHITYPDGSSEYFGYYSLYGDGDTGEFFWKLKRDGKLIYLRRDALHRVSEVDYPADAPSGGTIALAYDEFGRVTLARRVSSFSDIDTLSYTYDTLDRLTSVTPTAPQRALTFTYTPDLALNRWVTTETAAGLGAFTYKSDSKGRLLQVTNPYSQTFTYAYDLDGKPTLLTEPNGARVELSYLDVPAHQPTSGRDFLGSIVYRGSGGAIADALSYGYDPTGRVTRETDAGGRAHGFGYDPLYRLTTETHPDFGSAVYSYDADDNRTQKAVTGPPSSYTDYYGYDAASHSELVWVNRNSATAPNTAQTGTVGATYAYDADGRLTTLDRRYDPQTERKTTLFWDSGDHVNDARILDPATFTTQDMEYTYDPEGLRASQKDPVTNAVTHTYSRDLAGVLEDQSATADTVFTPGLAQHTAGAPSVDRFGLVDWQGSTRYLSDGANGTSFPSALRYDAYGQRTAEAGADGWLPTTFQWGGGLGDQTEYSSPTEPGTGLDLLGQREYDPSTGRFVSPDPIGLAGGLNLYAYVGDDPINHADPSGLFGVQFNGRSGIGIGDPIIDFTPEGLSTGLAALGSAASFGLWNGGRSRCNPGFAASRVAAGIARDALLQLAGAGLARWAGKVGLFTRIGGPVARVASVWNTGSAGDAAWATLSLKDKALYEVGQLWTKEEVNDTLIGLEPVAKGAALIEKYGWGLPEALDTLGAFKGRALDTGMTALGRFALQYTLAGTWLFGELRHHEDESCCE